MSKDSIEGAAPGGLSWRALVGAFAAYLGLAVVTTWPLACHLTSSLAHDAEDPLLIATILWWNAHVLPLTDRWLDGFFFFPATGALALSDHRLGLSFIASPLLWLGLAPVTAYNIVLLATYPLCALTAHMLAFALTKRHDAGIICGLAYGFNPFRVEHIPHLELLAAFGMPAALLALHAFAATRRWKWLALFTVALIVQGLCSSHYLLFFLVFVALWLVWFIRPREWPLAAVIAGACGVCMLVLSPIAVEFWRVHARFGLSRSLNEIVLYSADATSLFTGSSLLALWGWTARFNGNEARIFPGSTIMVLAALGTVAAVKHHRAARRLPLASITLLVVGGLFGAVAALTAALGPWRVTLGPIGLSGAAIYKPITVASVAVAGSIALSSPARDAWRGRSPLAFYLLAAVVLFLCAMGPRPAVLGHQFLYRPPYWWLMQLPVFDRGVRVPARFAMPAALALSVAAGLAFSRLTTRHSRQHAVALGVAVAGVLADSWVPGMPLAPVPDVWNPARAAGFAAVLELPLGGTGEDVRAMYRSIVHRHPTVNGYSGYSPPHYVPLRLALADRDDTALDSIAAAGPLLVVAEKEGEWAAFVRRHMTATALGDDGRWSFFSLPRAEPPPPACIGHAIAIAAASDNRGPIAVAAITDRNRLTAWTTGHAQHIGDAVTLDLGRVARPCAVVLSQLGFESFYPRALAVTTSIDGATWTPAFRGRTGGLLVHRALQSPRSPDLEIPLAATTARFLKLQLEENVERDWWAITEVDVRSEP